MSILQVCGETEDLGRGRFRHTQHLRPIAHMRNGVMRPMGYTFGQSGAVDMPVGVDEAMLVRFAPRIAGKSPLWEVRAPDRSQYARFALLGANNVAAKKVSDHEYVYANALNGADLALVYAGHYVAADLRLKAGHPSIVSWRMDAQAGFDPKTMTLGDMTIREPVLLPPERDMDKGSVELKWAVSQESGRYRLDCVLPRGDWRGWTLDPTLALQPDAAAGKDTLLSPWDGGVRNYGASRETIGNFWTHMVAFNVSSIPSTATVTSATASFFITRVGTAGGISTWRFYRILPGNTWVEGTQHNALARAGEPCWNARQADGAGGVTASWLGSAGCATPGVDYAATAVGSFTTYTTPGVFADASLAIAAVQLWIADPSNNEGLRWLRVSSYTRDAVFALSEYATAEARPKLVVEYTLPGGGNIFQSAIMHSAIYGGTLTR